MRAGIASIIAVAVLIALPTASTAQFAGSEKGCTQKVQHRRGSFSAKLHVIRDGHKPRTWRRIFERDRRIRAWDALWPIKVTARKGSRKISGGKVFYQFLFSGRVVACRTVKAPYKPRFHNGVFRDRIEWPERSIGLPLTFRVVVRTKYGVRNLDYKVVVQKRKK
jgi:hypothetical protein